MSGYTPTSEIPKIYHDLRVTFDSGLTKPIPWRRHQLLQLVRFAKENVAAIEESLRLDLGKPKQEALMTDIQRVIERGIITADKVAEWARPEPVVTQSLHAGWKPRIEKHPKGVVLIISPWNFPMSLSLQPLLGAIAAGCCAVIKPSEISGHFSRFLAYNLNKYLDPRAYRVILGGVPETTKILELKWDHIFYTGNSRIGRIISEAAAKHLTPTTLELGGKSPVIVDSTADIFLSAKRILWGKVTNAGQVCIAPDYVLAEKAILPAFVEALKIHYKNFFPNGALQSTSYGRIVSRSHYKRLKSLLENTEGNVAIGGRWDDESEKLGFEPTVVLDVKPGDSLLDEELFGPILPIMAIEDVDEAIRYLNSRDHPLVMYIFSTDEASKRKNPRALVIDNTHSGGVGINDTFTVTSVNELPFGGVGESGHGRQYLKYSFDNFVYLRSITDTPYGDEPTLAARYPPYTKASYELFRRILDIEIPEK